MEKKNPYWGIFIPKVVLYCILLRLDVDKIRNRGEKKRFFFSILIYIIGVACYHGDEAAQWICAGGQNVFFSALSQAAWAFITGFAYTWPRLRTLGHGMVKYSHSFGQSGRNSTKWWHPKVILRACLGRPTTRWLMDLRSRRSWPSGPGWSPLRCGRPSTTWYPLIRRTWCLRRMLRPRLLLLP